MEAKEGKTVKFMKQKRSVPKQVTERLKYFTKTKKLILDSLKKSDKTVPELANELNIPADEIMFLVMSLLKYGFIETGELDDMDEYFQYKISNNGQDKS